MNAQGFYKIQDGELFYAPNYVEGPGILLVSAEKDSYVYPVEGWIWAEDEAEARETLGMDPAPPSEFGT